PGHAGAPVVPDDVRPLDSQRVENASYVSDDGGEAVVYDVRWLAASSTSTHVRHDRAKAVLYERGHLVAPEITRIGKAVQQDDRRARPLIPNVELKPVGLDQLELHLRIKLDGAHQLRDVRDPAQARGADRVDLRDDPGLPARAEAHIDRLGRHGTDLGPGLLPGR